MILKGQCRMIQASICISVKSNWTKKFYLLYESASSTVYKERISAGYEARIQSVLSTDIFMTPLCPCPSFGVRYGIQPT